MVKCSGDIFKSFPGHLGWGSNELKDPTGTLSLIG